MITYRRLGLETRLEEAATPEEKGQIYHEAATALVQSPGFELLVYSLRAIEAQALNILYSNPSDGDAHKAIGTLNAIKALRQGIAGGLSVKWENEANDMFQEDTDEV